MRTKGKCSLLAICVLWWVRLGLKFGRLLGRQGRVGYAVNHTCESKLLSLGAFPEDCGVQLFLPWFCLRAGQTTVGRKRRKKTQPNANGSACLLTAPVGPK